MIPEGREQPAIKNIIGTMRTLNIDCTLDTMTVLKLNSLSVIIIL